MKLDNKLPKQNKEVFVDNDFASGFEDSWFDRLKPVLKVLMVVILLMSTAWGVSAYFSPTDTKIDTNKSYTSDTMQQTEDIRTEAQSIEEPSADSSSGAQHPDNPVPSDSSTQQLTNDSPAPAAKSYNLNECEPLNSEAARLRGVADQKKIVFDGMFAVRKNYGDIYSEVRNEYGNSSTMYEVVKVEAEKRYNTQEAQLNQLQAEWQDALNKGNAAYSEYQVCRAKL